jgi:thioredoxin reductase (NADPH)
VVGGIVARCEATVAELQFDVTVIGAGIAGLTAGLTAARLGRKTLVLTGHVLGGQLLSIERVDGYPGFPEGVAGYDLCPMAQEQAADAGAEFAAAEVERLDAAAGGWRLATSEGDFATRAVLLATGCSLRELGASGEERLRGKGVSHCATCDAPLLRDRLVAVVGGGDSGLQEALTLAEHASRVIILERGVALTGQAVYRDRVSSNPKVDIRCNTIVEEILGSDKVTAVRVRDMADGTTTELETAGVFVYIGLKPNTTLLQGQLALDSSGAILTDAWMRTGATGVFAAGTVRSGSPARAVSSASDGATAAIAVDRYLADGIWRGHNSDKAARHAAGG